MMPDQLESIVQKMIDAGEPEQNIGAVILEFKQRASGRQTEPRIGANLHQEAKIGAATPGTALPSDLEPMIGQQGREFMNAPLVHPTGIDAIDSLSSPTSLLMTAASAGPAVARVAGRVVGRLPLATAAKAAHAVYSLAHGNPVPALRSAAGAVLREVGKQATREAPAAAVESAAPVAAKAVATFNPSTALKAAKDAFTALGETPRPAEASNAMEQIRRGLLPEDAVKRVLSFRKDVPLSPADQLAQLPGMMSDAEARAALDLRNARGEIKTPSAETARARRGR